MPNDALGHVDMESVSRFMVDCPNCPDFCRHTYDANFKHSRAYPLQEPFYSLLKHTCIPSKTSKMKALAQSLPMPSKACRRETHQGCGHTRARIAGGRTFVNICVPSLPTSYNLPFTDYTHIISYSLLAHSGARLPKNAAMPSLESALFACNAMALPAQLAAVS